MQADSNDYYYVHDHLYSPAALLDDDGSVLERYEYDAYGYPHIMNASYESRETSDYSNPYMFTGRRVDILDSNSLTLQYNRNRYYDYYTGRWLTQDPLGYVDSVNLYEYASSNPVITIDPSGSSVEAIGMALDVAVRIVRYCGGVDLLYQLYQVRQAATRLLDTKCVHGAFTGGGNPYKHCVWSCEVAKHWGKEQAKKCGRLKEDLDWAIANFGDSISSSCWNRLRREWPGSWVTKKIAYWACSAYQRSDLRDNAAGRDCGTDSCLMCRYPMCEDCCENAKGIGPRTREGPDTTDRPYSPRCRDRYKREIRGPETSEPEIIKGPGL